MCVGRVEDGADDLLASVIFCCPSILIVRSRNVVAHHRTFVALSLVWSPAAFFTHSKTDVAPVTTALS